MAPRSTNRVMIGAALTAVLLAGCGGSDSGKDAVLKGTTSATTAKQSTTSVAETSTSTQTTNESDGAAASPWDLDAQKYRGQNGKRFTIECPPNGTESIFWGTGVYTDDSSICMAAVHSGLITLAAGGEVEIEIAPGESAYTGSTANGVTSTRYGSWSGSFIFPAAPPGSVQSNAGPESWQRKAQDYRGQDGKQVNVECSTNGEPGSVWGTGTYTDDSSICTAAVHSGLITLAEGGAVVIEIAPGENAYTGTTANGITSESYGSFSGSFKFPTPVPNS